MVDLNGSGDSGRFEKNRSKRESGAKEKDTRGRIISQFEHHVNVRALQFHPQSQRRCRPNQPQPQPPRTLRSSFQSRRLHLASVFGDNKLYPDLLLLMLDTNWIISIFQMHLAANPPAVNNRKLPPPLQMQSELLWFKDVEKMVPPTCVVMENKQGLKPRELFSKTHKRLLKESELWMKNTADSCMLIATILLTVVFAAAFTVPGGYGSQTGEPVLAKRHWFKVFLVFQVLGFIGSVVSIIVFRSIMASHFTEREFLLKLPLLQMLRFEALLLSLVGAFSAFMSSISLFNLNMNALVWFGFCTLYFFGSLWVITEVGVVYRDVVQKKSIIPNKRRHTLFNQDPTATKVQSFLDNLQMMKASYGSRF